MLITYFKQYIKVSRGVSDKSVNHYVTGLNTINNLLQKYCFPIESVFSVSSVEDLNSIKEFLDSNEEFRKKDSTGHNMYSVAFKHFYRFACEDNAFFNNNITAMDIIVNKPERVSSSVSQWKRNQIIITQAIEGASHECECNSEHVTFTSNSTGKAYMEGHHLIPLKYQSQFTFSIDIYANVVCLCPICHRLLHYAENREKKYTAEKLFDCRQQRLKNSGIDISKKEFIELLL